MHLRMRVTTFLVVGGGGGSGRGCEGWALPSLSGRGGEHATGSAGQVNRVTDEPALRSTQSVSLWIGQDSSASFCKRGNQSSLATCPLITRWQGARLEPGALSISSHIWNPPGVTPASVSKHHRHQQLQ